MRNDRRALLLAINVDREYGRQNIIAICQSQGTALPGLAVRTELCLQAIQASAKLAAEIHKLTSQTHSEARNQRASTRAAEAR